MFAGICATRNANAISRWPSAWGRISYSNPRYSACALILAVSTIPIIAVVSEILKATRNCHAVFREDRITDNVAVDLSKTCFVFRMQFWMIVLSSSINY